MNEKYIHVGGAGAGYHPPIPEQKDDPNSYGNRLFKRIRQLREGGMDFWAAHAKAKEHLMDEIAAGVGPEIHGRTE